MRVGFHTFGCKLNQFETEALAAAFNANGFDIVNANQDAEMYVINTCTVTARADHKARALIRSVSRRNPAVPVIVTGCTAELEALALAGLGANVVVVPQREKPSLLEMPGLLRGPAMGVPVGGASSGRPAVPRVSDVAGALSRFSGVKHDPFLFRAREMSFHTRAYLKIQDGCDASCAYCRVPLARGPSVSLRAEDVLLRTAELESRRYREIVITGVNISAYRSGRLDLPALLEGILSGTTGVRLRLSSLEPEAIDERLAAALAERRICSHFHLPVQSGSDAVLEGMQRRYTSAGVIAAARLLRQAKGDPFLAADIIVGFPGESEQDFVETVRMIETVGFAALHVFPFSPRPGTAAFGLRGRIPERVRSRRAAELMRLSRRLKAAYLSRWVGREVEVIFERGAGRASSGSGLTSNYVKVIVGGIPPSEGDATGRIGRVRIESAGGEDPEGMCRGVFLGFPA
jgi:threonylcarbamoyladenosine tRNA methylthiotransferase MtaB